MRGFAIPLQYIGPVLLILTAARPLAGEVKPVRVDGSSTVYPITQLVAAEFERLMSRTIKVSVAFSGTSGGFRRFCRGETDINDASRPILKTEIEACKRAGIYFYELPIAYDAITVVVNRANRWVDFLSVDELKHIWQPSAQAHITQWRQVRPVWPRTPIRLFGSGTDSGTFDYFTEAIVGSMRASRNDFSASEDDNVLARGIADDKSALGYFGYAYYLKNEKFLRAVAISNGKVAVLPNIQNVDNGTYQPLSRPLFLYANAQSLEQLEA